VVAGGVFVLLQQPEQLPDGKCDLFCWWQGLIFKPQASLVDPIKGKANQFNKDFFLGFIVVIDEPLGDFGCQSDV